MAASIFGNEGRRLRRIDVGDHTGLSPNQRPSGAQPLVRTGLPQPTTS